VLDVLTHGAATAFFHEGNLLLSGSGAQVRGKVEAVQQLMSMGPTLLGLPAQHQWGSGGESEASAAKALQHEALQLTEAVAILADERLPELTDAAARLNDTHILAVSGSGAVCV